MTEPNSVIAADEALIVLSKDGEVLYIAGFTNVEVAKRELLHVTAWYYVKHNCQCDAKIYLVL